MTRVADRLSENNGNTEKSDTLDQSGLNIGARDQAILLLKKTQYSADPFFNVENKVKVSLARKVVSSIGDRLRSKDLIGNNLPL